MKVNILVTNKVKTVKEIEEYCELPDKDVGEEMQKRKSTVIKDTIFDVYLVNK